MTSSFPVISSMAAHQHLYRHHAGYTCRDAHAVPSQALLLQNGLSGPGDGQAAATTKLQGSQAAASRTWHVLAKMTWVGPQLQY